MDFYYSLEHVQEILHRKQTSKWKKCAVKKQGDGRDFQKKKGKEKKEIVD